MAVLSTPGKNARRPTGERTLRQRPLRTRPRRPACTLVGRIPHTALRRPRETCSRTFRERTSARLPVRAVPQSPGRFPLPARRPSAWQFLGALACLLLFLSAHGAPFYSSYLCWNPTADIQPPGPRDRKVFLSTRA